MGYVALRTSFVYLQSCPVGACAELAQSASFVLLATFMLFWLVERFDIGLLFFAILPLNAVLTLVCLVFDLPSGLIGNPSMNGTFMVAALFFFLDHLRPAWIATVFAAIIAQSVVGSGTSIPIGILGVGASAYALAKYRWKAAPWIIAIFAAITLFGVFAVPEFFNSWDRFTRWPVFFREWEKLDVKWLGAGGGSFWVYGPMIQHSLFGAPGKEIEIMRHMHSDWAQLYLEFGFMGIILAVAALVSSLRTAKTQPGTFAAISSLSVAAIFNWPMHCALTALFAVFLVTCDYGPREYPSRRLKRRHRKSGS